MKASNPDGGFDVDRALGEPGEQLVRVPFLVEGLLQDLGLLLLAEDLSPGPYRAVARHLIVLDALGGADQGGVHHVGIHVLLHHLLALLDQPLHGLALLATGGLAEHFEDAVQALDLHFGHGAVILERLLELLVLSLLDHLRKGLKDLLLSAVKVLELVHVELPEGIDLHDALLFSIQAPLPSGVAEARGVPERKNPPSTAWRGDRGGASRRALKSAVPTASPALASRFWGRACRPRRRGPCRCCPPASGSGCR